MNDSADAIPGNDTNALLTHPIVTDYATFAAANPTNYNPTPSNNSNGGSGEVRLVNGGVSCTSCHGVHFTDSDSSTIDGRAAIDNDTLAEGDGHLLRADGPGKANKSALCQSCHTYKEHGKVGNDAAGSGLGDVQIGCLVCHSGHVYDATAPNFFVLRKTVDSTAAGYGSTSNLLYTTYPTAWASYCVTCHGAVTSYTLRPHSLPADNDCAMCHAHNATTYSFAQGSSGTACSSCHGAPPRTDTAADRVNNVLPDTGYAVGSNGINYRSANQNGKDESQTPHKLHAGALNEDKAPTDYAFGSGSILNACLPCHNDKEDAVSPPSPSHDKADSNLSFQDVHFSTFATYNGVLTSTLYKTTNPNQWMCSGIYCHSNGGKRTGAAKVLADFKTATTKSWEFGSTTNKIVGTADECQQCHGENRASMVLAQKNNSPTHDKHLLKLGDGKTKCYLCHSATVDSTGTIPAAARDHRFGGTHVNGTVNVVFSTTALNGELVGGTYPADNSGTCVVYCHSDAIGGPPALVPDWDFATGTIVCGSCHGITAATLTSNSHPIHINSAKAKVKCSSCHGLNADTGTHSGHVDGVITKLTTAASCDLCHGVELASGKSWDASPTWGVAASADCRTCHTGSVLTSYVNTASTTIVVNTTNNLSKTLHESDGHSRTTPFTLTGKPAASKNCTACHVMPTPAGTGHVDGLGNSKLLIGGFSCEACHTAAGSRSNEATVDVQSHGNQTAGYTKKAYNAAFTKTCLACHDPHGTINGAMIENLRTKQNAKDATANFAGNVVFSSLLVGNSFDEADSGASANNDDLCATCHSTTLHNNRAAVAANHHEGENCTTTCHGHNGAKGGFMPSNGTACNDCHGNPPSASDPRPADSVGAHAAHTKVGTHAPSEDLFDCAVCHQGGESFALDGAHSSAPLVVAIGYNAGDGTCSGACHLSTAGDGYWNDSDGLDCASCHNNVVKPLSLTHNKHFAAGKVCIDCHTAPEAADAGAHPDIDVKRTHITDHDAWDLNATNDGTVLADRGAATQDEATVIVPTWSDGANTCSNAACHNPSGLSNTATWGNTNGVGCNFCHSSTNPDTGKGTPGSHGAHMNAAGIFGITSIACTSCHPNNTLNSHLNSAVDLNGGFVYSASLTDYTSSTFGRCTTTSCHNNGKGVAVQTPVPWGTSYANCTICHNNGSGAAQPNTGRHNKHVANTSYVANACGNCHANATATTMTGATTHINGTAQTGIDITAHTAGTATCTNNCHLVDLARGDWLDANFLTCTDCHGRSGSAGGAYPTSGLHTGTLTVSANTHDNSFQVTKGGASSGTCETCHSGINLAGDLPATHIAGGAPAAAQAALHTDLGYLAGATATCGPNNTLVNCHTDKGAWKRRWNTTATATNGNQCGNCHGTFDLTFVTGVGQRHGSDPQVHGGHNGVDDCYICHTYKAGDTTYYNIANAPTGQHRDNIIQLNNGMVFTDDGATVHCTGCHDTVPLGLADGQYSFQDTYNGDGADGGLNRWGRALQAGPPANCNGCHALTNGLTHLDTNESATVHTVHTGSPLSPGCGACHADSGPGGANHQNNSLNFGGTYLSLTAYAVTPGVGGVFTNTNCSSANGCHNSIIDSWKNDSLGTGTQPCIACHASAKLLDQQGYPPTSNEHSAHTGNNAYVGTTASNDCDDCHGAGSSTGSHGATHSNGVKNVTNKVNNDYNASLGTCTNTCHNVVNGRDWTSITTLDCIDCHSGTFIGKANKNNLSGLHQTNPALAHDDAFPRPNAAPDGTCTSCHTAINLTTPASHVDGVTTDPNTAFGLFASYDTSAASTCSGAGVATNCHSDGGDWTRKWNNVVNARPLPTDDPATATVCRNCHGTFFTGWNSLSASHIDPDLDNSGDQMQAGGHLVCEKCHGWGNANYNKTWLGSSNINYDGHGDGHITMNGPVPDGTGYNPATRGCDTINCHGASTLTLNATSGWTVNYGNFGGAGACGACHADGQLPPTSGSHAAHGADNDSDYSECEACHGTNNGGDWATGSGGTHNLGGVNFAAGVTYSGGATGTCSTTQCHSESPEVATWGTPASLGCDECHNATATVVANNAGRTLSDSHNTHFAKGKTCSQCHTVLANRTHISAGAGTDGFILTGRANAAQDEATITITAASIDGGNSCSGTTGIGLGCHNTKPTPAWGTTGIGCSNCHVPGGGAAADPASGLHNMTAINVQPHNATLRTGCTECHAPMTSDPATHIDGVWEDDANNNMSGAQPRFLSGTRTALAYSEGTPNSSTCWDDGASGAATSLDYSGGASCHRDNGVWKRLWSTAANVDMSILANQDPGLPVCDVCHGQYASSQGWREGSVHYRSGNNAAEAKGSSHNKSGGNANKCKDCHAYYPGGVSNHENTILNFSGTGVATLPNYALTAGTSGLYCATCHNANSAEVATNTGTHTFPATTIFGSPVYVGGPTLPEGSCTNCHGNTAAGNFWPDGTTGHTGAGQYESVANDINQAGKHAVHVLEIAKKLHGTGSPSIAQQNLTCSYCHPGNTHGGLNGTLPADVSRTDSANDDTPDLELGTTMKKIVSPFASDSLGFWRRTPGTCSNVACHARGPFTPHWYGDTTKPNPVTTLAASAGTEPGSVTLTWTAKGDDADLDGIAYRLDVRMSASNITNETDFNNAIKAPGIPAVRRAGNLQTMVVRGLPMGALRYFAVRTIDKAGNASLMSNVVSRAANTDAVAPVFGGIDAAVVPTDASGTVLLDWTPAEDHTMPLSYKVWYSNTAINFGDIPITTTGTSLKLEGLNTNGDVYEFAVRACDANAICDTNTFKKQAIPQVAATLGTAPKLYYANGAVASSVVAMNNTGYTATGSVTLTTGGTVFIYGTQYPYPVNIYGDSFTIYLANTNGGGTATASLGSVDSAGTAASFVSLASSGQITLASKAKGIKSFKFNGAGGSVAATRKLAVKVVLGTGSVTASWGSTANAGVLSLTDQFVNSAPTSPGTPVITGPSSGTAGVLGISWTLATDVADGVADTVHYDVYGSINGGSTFPFVIAKDLPSATTSTTWNTIEEGLGVLSPLSNLVQIRVQAGDGYTHTVGTTANRTIDNTTDVVAPAAVSNFIAETRPKAGSVYLSWTAPGDDGANNGRASSYDIRWSTSTITDGALWTGATTVDYEPYPDFGGETQHYEVLDLTPGTNYYFAIKASDGINLSPLATTTIAEKGGPNCGGCHATPPSESGAVGNHERHGFTLNDCAKCHGDQALTFTTAHQDGDILYGYNNNVYKQNIDVDTIRIFYTADGTAGGTVLYEDINGSGGFNPTGTGQIDSGTCMNWSALGISGCHGPAGTDPDGAETEYPLYAKPEWRDTATLTCSNCHGNSNRTADAYGRAFDGGTVDQIKSSPAIDNHGYTGEGADFTEPKGKYVGQHEKHLNYSFRLSKGDSCNLCHKGKYTTMGALDGKHANGDIDIELDQNAAGIGATWLEGPDANTAGSCSGMSQVTCHPNESVKWSSTVSYDCIKCHFMGNVIPQHVTDPFKAITDISMNGDTTNTLEGGPMAGNCTWCHFAGHPQGAVSGSFVIPNNPIIGINYKSGGIHLRNNIGDRTAVTTEAQLCWGCHYSQVPVISEWGADSGGSNTWSNPPNGNLYNYGSLTATPNGAGNWIGASWRSGTAAFTYKDGAIKSTHATGGTWTATVTTDRFRTSTEANDSVGDIRCSNCHDVHNLNRAPGDTSPYAAGNPYLRGTWLSNPYKEDGAPLSSLTYTATTNFGAVPRGGTGYVETGGYYIDQNSGNPTATYSLTTSAGLCVLCHGINVNGMDKVSGENLWLGTNGHSNSAIGGTGSAGADIFSYAWRNPTLAPPTYTASYVTGGNPNMGYQNAADYSASARADGFRSAYDTSYGWNAVQPDVATSTYTHTSGPFDWGVTQNTGTVETGYHNFSCSKCHNPHASRLPKLMITNCLDTSHNTWDNTRPTGGLTGTSGAGTALATDNVGRTLADVGSAQNCHRYVTKFTTTATNISFPAGGTTIQSVTAIFTAANKYHVNDRIRITGGVNAGKVGTISSMTTTILTLSNINDANGSSTTLTQAAAGPSITLTGARGGWNKITPW